MTASVSQASGLAVQVSSSGARPTRRGGDADGFDRLLEPAARNHGNADGKASKIKDVGVHGRERRQAAPEEPDVLVRAATPAVDADRAADAQPGPDKADEVQVDPADESHAGDGEETALPTRIKVEQAISALMAMTPAARRPEPASGGKAAAGGEAPAPRSTALEVLTRKGHADQRALDAIAGDAPQRTGQAGADVAGAAKAGAAPAADMVGPAVAAETGAVAQSRTRAGKARPAADGGDGGIEGKGGRPAPIGAAASQSEAARAATAGAAASAKNSAGGKPDVAGGGNGDGKAAAGERRSDQQPAAGKVSVIGQQTVPAPAPVQLGVNASAVVAAIAGEHGPRSAGAGALESALAFRDAQPMRSLKLEMHPAELGTVTVNLRAAGERMSVELQVENREAYERLSADSDAIVRSLRSLGYEIDRVSIQQPQAATATVMRAEQNAAAGGFSRDASSFQPGNSGNGSERSAGENNGQGSRNDAQHRDQPREIGQDRAGGSLYI